MNRRTWASTWQRKAVRTLELTFAMLVLAGAIRTPLVANADPNDTPPVDGKNCWETGNTGNCRTTWPSTAPDIYIRLIDQFSGAIPSLSTPATSAATAWSGVPGPQYVSFTPASNDSWVYISDVSLPHWSGLTAIHEAVNTNCDTSYTCTTRTSVYAMNTWYSDIYLYEPNITSDSSTHKQWLIGHEVGHSMGLLHNLNTSSSIMYPSDTSTTPQSVDYGEYPGCANSGGGTRCVFGQGR